MSEFNPVVLTLPSPVPALSLEILPHGLTFHRLIAQVDGKSHDILIGPEDPKDHLLKKYINTIIGRYSNRVPVGTHELERKGFKASFTAQPNENARVSLHGGPTGFDAVPWEHLGPSNPPTLFSTAELSYLSKPASESSHAFFRLVSPDGDQGYPGTLKVEVLVALVPAPKTEGEESSLGSVVYVYRAKLDKGVTPINLTQHWGFNLNASLQDGPDSLSIMDHNLLIKADRIVARDADNLHTGQYTSVADAPVHKHDGKKISDNYPDGGYDDFYVFKTRPETVPRRVPFSSLIPEFDLMKDLLTPGAKELDSLVELSSEKSGLKIVFESNQTGAMFYDNGRANPAATSRKKTHGGSGQKGDGYTPGSAAFLEFHEILSAFTDPANKEKDDTLLTEEELYHNFVRCDIRYKAPRK